MCVRGFAPASQRAHAFFKEQIKMEKVSKEIAEKELERIAKAARKKVEYIDTEDKEMIIDDIIDGWITVNEDGFPCVITENEDLPEVNFKRRPCGFDWKVFDKYGEGKNVTKMNAMMGSVLGIAPALIEKLEEPDFQRVKRVFSVFLAGRG